MDQKDEVRQTVRAMVAKAMVSKGLMAPPVFSDVAQFASSAASRDVRWDTRGGGFAALSSEPHHGSGGSQDPSWDAAAATEAFVSELTDNVMKVFETTGDGFLQHESKTGLSPGAADIADGLEELRGLGLAMDEAILEARICVEDGRNFLKSWKSHIR